MTARPRPERPSTSLVDEHDRAGVAASGGGPATLTKRIFDVAFALVVLVGLTPIWLPALLGITLTDGRPIFFRQERIGRDGRPFTMLKFRSMRVNNDDSALREMNRRELAGELTGTETSDGLFKLEHDPRITRVGSVLRRFSIDELPQLLNVLTGDMSVVGPRPSLPWEVELFEPRFRRREEVRPGLTGLWQVSGRNRLSMPEMLEMDLRYVNEWSFRNDLLILLKTPFAVLRGDGAR